jgi:hypothetical protein
MSIQSNPSISISDVKLTAGSSDDVFGSNVVALHTSEGTPEPKLGANQPLKSKVNEYYSPKEVQRLSTRLGNLNPKANNGFGTFVELLKDVGGVSAVRVGTDHTNGDLAVYNGRGEQLPVTQNQINLIGYALQNEIDRRSR